MRSICAQSGTCEHCRTPIVRMTKWQPWRAQTGPLSLIDAEYCPESASHAHKLAPTIVWCEDEAETLVASVRASGPLSVALGLDRYRPRHLRRKGRRIAYSAAQED